MSLIQKERAVDGVSFDVNGVSIIDAVAKIDNVDSGFGTDDIHIIIYLMSIDLLCHCVNTRFRKVLQTHTMYLTITRLQKTLNSRSGV